MGLTTITSAPSGIDAHLYLVKDMARALVLYRDALGLTPNQEFNSESFAEFDLPDGSTFGIGVLPDWQQCGGVMFAVDDVDAMLQRVTAAGATLQGEIYDGPICRMAWCADPDGNSFALHHRKQN